MNLTCIVCLAYTHQVILSMHPVISVDAAHLKSAYKGKKVIYAGLTLMTKHTLWHLEFVVEMKTTELGIHSSDCL